MSILFMFVRADKRDAELVFDRGSSNGRTEAFEAFYRGSTPCPRTSFQRMR